jgi:hypothetical protein
MKRRLPASTVLLLLLTASLTVLSLALLADLAVQISIGRR